MNLAQTCQWIILGNFGYSNSARGFQGGQSGQGVQGGQVGQSGYESTNQGGFGSNSRFSGPPQGYQQENPNFGAQGFGGPRFDTSQNSLRGGYQERPGYNQGGGYNRPPYNSQPNHMQNYQRWVAYLINRFSISFEIFYVSLLLYHVNIAYFY